jgi:hypothetical protein
MSHIHTLLAGHMPAKLWPKNTHRFFSFILINNFSTVVSRHTHFFHLLLLFDRFFSPLRSLSVDDDRLDSFKMMNQSIVATIEE